MSMGQIGNSIQINSIGQYADTLETYLSLINYTWHGSTQVLCMGECNLEYALTLMN